MKMMTTLKGDQQQVRALRHTAQTMIYGIIVMVFCFALSLLKEPTHYADAYNQMIEADVVSFLRIARWWFLVGVALMGIAWALSLHKAYCIEYPFAAACRVRAQHGARNSTELSGKDRS